ncbi:MAG TPA: RNA polymerase sigma factor SigW [Firmicutes bacterium]|nr:RNA polymerase sigma factor SigW [Bacillota bacterium]
MQTSDWELVSRAQKGDLDAFTLIVNQYKVRLLGYILRMIHSREDAEDVLQEVFLRVYSSLSRYSPQYQFSTWIYRITQNLCIDYLRRRKLSTFSVDQKFGTEDELTLELPDDSMSPETIFESQEIRKEIEEAIYGLPIKYRSVIILRHIQDLSYEDISQIMDMPVNTVKTHIFRARRILRRRLQDAI